MNVPEVLEAVPGLTYRQLDHWLNCGYVKARVTHPGSGNARSLTPGEVKVLQHMLPLVELGVTPSKAAPLARTIARGKSVALANGVVLSVRRTAAV